MREKKNEPFLLQIYKEDDYKVIENKLSVVSRYMPALRFYNYGNESWRNILQSIEKYCTSKLKHLDIKSAMDDEDWKMLKTVVKHLEELLLYGGGSLSSDHLDLMINLKSLHLSNINANFHSTVQLTNMKHMQFFYNCHTIKIDDLSMIHIVNQTKNLKTLSIEATQQQLLSHRVFGAIGQLKELEKLEFSIPYMKISDTFQDDLMLLTTLSNLKILNFNCAKQSLYELFARGL